MSNYQNCARLSPMETLASPSSSATMTELRCVAFIAMCLLMTTSGSAQDIITYSIEEESQTGSQVGQVFVDAGLDRNEEVAKNGYLVFTDETSKTASLFTLNAGRVLTVSDRLDRETLCPGQEDCTISLDLQLEPQAYFQIIKVRVRILDINDNAPAFSGPVISRSVSEAASVGFKIPLPSATDPDSPANGIDHYWIDGTSGIFELDRTSSPAQFLTLKKQLDREQQDSYRIQLTAIDKGNPPKSGSTMLEINVVDVNDNLPKFDNETYYVIIPEDFPLGLSVLSVHATDPDAGNYGEIHYGFDAATELKYGEYFTIDEVTGVIKVIKALDYETMTTASLMVTATNTDGSSMSSFTNVHIAIGDVNDNAPEIKVRGLQPGNIIYKEETSVLDDFVAHVSVSDPDSGANGEFECLLSGNNFKLIKIYNTDYVIHNNIPLDREYQAEYNVVITCVDKGKQRQTQIQEVRIVVSDINDHAPVFSKAQYYASVVENNAVGAQVMSVTAVDPDAGRNGTVTYAFLDYVNDTLHVEKNTGIIIALKPLDREATQSIIVRIVASDMGTPQPLSSTATVNIDVVDEDDNPPAFTSSQYSFWITEGQAIQSYVGQVNATDPDTDIFNQFGYFINYDGGDSESFTIDRHSGRIYTSRVLDRETHLVYRFEIRAVSDGPITKSSTASVRVHLTDINDNKPQIKYPNPNNSTIYIANDVEAGTAIARIEAWDIDEGNNSDLVYYIVSGNDGGHFSITRDGTVTIAKSLRQFEQRGFGLVIVVADSGSPPLSTESYLNVVVNKSLSAPSSGLMSRHNLTIVIAIATVSGLLMVVLIVAIVVLLRWPKMRSTAPKYNYVARQLDHKRNTDAETGRSNSFDNKSCHTENDNESKVLQQHPPALNSKTYYMHPQQEPSPYQERESAPSFNFQSNIVRHKGNESECSSASSAVETDSGRGSHEDVVLDQSPTKVQLDRSRDAEDFHRSNNLPLLNPLHKPPRLGTEPSTNWMPSTLSGYSTHPANEEYHARIQAPFHCNTQQYSPEGTPDTCSLSHDPYVTRDQRPGYSWQTSKVSSEVTV